MKILMVSPGSLFPVRCYGGAQRVVWSLGKALTQLGHEVDALCRRGSEWPFGKALYFDPKTPLQAQLPACGYDILHFHTAPPAGVEQPHIETIHGNFNKTISKNAVFLSRDHAGRFGSDQYVYNGLDWDEYPAPKQNARRTYFHFLGKAAWRVKNVRGAIEITKSIPGAELRVLGGYRLNFKMGFRLTLSPRIKFHGMVTDAEKAVLLNGSRGMVSPILWQEPFGLAVIESLYYGAPVFATPRGALPEIVTSETGFLSNDYAELARAMQGMHFNPNVCHRLARERFNAKNMALGYLEKYERALTSNSISEVE